MSSGHVFFAIAPLAELCWSLTVSFVCFSSCCHCYPMFVCGGIRLRWVSLLGGAASGHVSDFVCTWLERGSDLRFSDASRGTAGVCVLDWALWLQLVWNASFTKIKESQMGLLGVGRQYSDPENFQNIPHWSTGTSRPDSTWLWKLSALPTKSFQREQ